MVNVRKKKIKVLQGVSLRVARWATFEEGILERQRKRICSWLLQNVTLNIYCNLKVASPKWPGCSPWQFQQPRTGKQLVQIHLLCQKFGTEVDPIPEETLAAPVQTNFHAAGWRDYCKRLKNKCFTEQIHIICNSLSIFPFHLSAWTLLHNYFLSSKYWLISPANLNFLLADLVVML